MIVCGVDLGTQSLKCICYDSESKRIVAEASAPIELISGADGVREQKAVWWTDALADCFEHIDTKIKKQIKAIAVSGQQHGFVPVAEDGTVLYNVKLWCDTSTSQECLELMDRAGGQEAVHRRTGNPVMPGYTASKILWLKQQKPELYAKLRHVLLPHDYLNYYLTGIAFMERGDASGTGLMNIYTDQWDALLVDAIGPELKEKLPPISQSDVVVGHVKQDIASLLGIVDDVVVAAGGGDNMMSAIGTGTVADGSITMSLGTSGTLFGASSKPISDMQGRLAAFCSSTNSYLPLLCTMNCTVSSELLRQLFSLEVKEFDALAAKASAGAEGVVLLPFFNGERIPNLPNGKGVLCGLTLDNTTRENILRATLEGVTFGFLLGLDAFRELGMNPTEICLTGGGANSDIWRQMVADITGLKIKVPARKESAAFGAALQALWVATGIPMEQLVEEHVSYLPEKGCIPDPFNHVQYAEYYKKWLEYVELFAKAFS